MDRADHVDTIEFRAAGDPGGFAEVRVIIGGIDLVERVAAFERDHGYEPSGSYGGLTPEIDLPQSATAHFRRADRPVAVLGCECGISACWPLEVAIDVDDDAVRWSGFAQPLRPAWSYDGFGPFRFDRADYDAALAELERALGRAAFRREAT